VVFNGYVLNPLRVACPANPTRFALTRVGFVGSTCLGNETRPKNVSDTSATSVTNSGHVSLKKAVCGPSKTFFLLHFTHRLEQQES
jgi:hypothetical protein